MRTIHLSGMLLIAASLLLHAQTKAAPAAEQVRTGWREGLLTELSAALDIAKKQRGGVVVCFSGEPLGDNSVVAQVFRSTKVRDWATGNKLTLALIEFPRPGTPDLEKAKARFFELTRQFKIAGSRTWMMLDATGKELGRLSKEDVVPADGDGNLINKCDPDVWLRQAERVMKGERPQLLAKPTNPKEGWYALFGGKAWTGKRTVSGPEGAMNYTLFIPENLTSGKKYPLIIWLHGGGASNGDQINDEDAVSLGASASEPGNEKFLLIPSAPVGQTWKRTPVGAADTAISEAGPAMKLIVRLIDSLPNTYNIDRGKVIVMGESGGAGGSWALLEFYPERFLGGVINSGVGDTTRVNRLLKQRIWVFHGEKDQRIPVARGEEMFEALMNSRGGRPRVVTEGDWVKASDEADMIRFWKHAQSGHVPSVDYKAALNWVLATH